MHLELCRQRRSGPVVVCRARARRRVAAALAWGVLVFYGVARAERPATDAFLQAARLTASDGKHNDELGFSTAVSADGSTLVAGAWIATVAGKPGQGALYVFQRAGQSWSDAMEVAKLTASDGASGDMLGYAVAISADGSTVVAGAVFAPYTTVNGPGAAYVFVRPAGGWKNATETARFTGTNAFLYGISVAISGDGSTIAVGASEGPSGGTVYLYLLPPGGWTTGTETATLAGSDAERDKFLGHAVAISRDGSTVVAGANAANAVYVFVRPGPRWATGTEAARFTPAAGDSNFGLAVAVSADGSTVVAGAVNFSPAPGPGAAYVFVRPQGGWSKVDAAARLTASSPGPGDWLGGSVAVSGDGTVVLAGAQGAGRGNQGAAYEFDRPAGGAGGAGQWRSATETATLTVLDGAQGSFIGASVAISDDGSTVAVGALGAAVSGHTGAGAVYVFGTRCPASDTTLCLDDQPGDQRWQIGATFTSSSAGGGSGHAIPLAVRGVSHGGLFWFFGADNPEMLIKVLNGCGINQHFWVFYAATTNVGFKVTVSDHRTGTLRSYGNPNDQAAAPLQDTSAFACAAGRSAAGGSEDRQPAVERRGSPPSEEAVATAPGAAAALPAAAAGCSPGPTAVCIQGRFQIGVTYQTGSLSGAGQAIDLQGLGVARGGLFWFFGLDNPEMLIKVLDGCALNQHFWVFYAATTDVGFTVTVTDTVTRQQRFYENQNGRAALPLQDTSAFPCS